MAQKYLFSTKLFQDQQAFILHLIHGNAIFYILESQNIHRPWKKTISPNLVPLLILVLLGELLSALEYISPIGFAGNLVRNA